MVPPRECGTIASYRRKNPPFHEPRRVQSTMGIGSIIRGGLGPLERPVANLYRRYFIDLGRLAQQIRGATRARRILEVGCGEGALVEQLKEQFPESSITGIDITPRIGRLYQGDRSNVTLKQATIQEIVRDSAGSFDLVVLADVLHHVPPGQRRELLAAIREALSPGGIFALKDWERGRNLAHLLCWFSDRWISGEEVRFFAPGELRALVEDAFG